MSWSVCYRASEEQVNDADEGASGGVAGGDALEAFKKELEEAGRMTEDRKHMFKQLTDKPTHEAASNDDTSSSRRNPKEKVRQIIRDMQPQKEPIILYLCFVFLVEEFLSLSSLVTVFLYSMVIFNHFYHFVDSSMLFDVTIEDCIL